MTQPFDDKDVLYRFTPSEEERRRTGMAEEYLAVRRADWPNMVLFYGRVGEVYAQDELFAGRVIARLLTEREELRKFGLIGGERKLLQAIETLKAERDRLKAALEQYADEEYWDVADGIHNLLWAGNNEHGYALAQEVLSKKEN